MIVSDASPVRITCQTAADGGIPKRVAKIAAGGMGKRRLARGNIRHGQIPMYIGIHATPNGMHPPPIERSGSAGREGAAAMVIDLAAPGWTAARHRVHYRLGADISAMWEGDWSGELRMSGRWSAAGDPPGRRQNAQFLPR